MKTFPIAALLNWFSKHRRPLPWRTHYEPYHVWLSEIMLQQTRVEQALPYYERFLQKFPTLQALAKSDEQSVLKRWEGLGYYSRARNLHSAAKKIASEFDSKIPDNYNQLVLLPGFGEYVAAAVASIAFNEPVPLVDGNVFRLLSRFYGIKSDISKPKTKKEFLELAGKIIPKDNPRDFNQGLMELGALVCTPKNPSCEKCLLSENCFARLNSRQCLFPYKSKKPKRPIKNFAAVLLCQNDSVWLVKRKQKLLHALFEFPQVEYNPLSEGKNELEKKFQKQFKAKLKIKNQVASARHEYTHFKQNVYLFEATLVQKKLLEFSFFSKKEIANLPLSRVNQKLLERLA
ncbi:MAG: A/G-specific adenine glycosylase [Candidatus Micrarchaeota archaeon]